MSWRAAVNLCLVGKSGRVSHRPCDTRALGVQGEGRAKDMSSFPAPHPALSSLPQVVPATPTPTPTPRALSPTPGFQTQQGPKNLHFSKFSGLPAGTTHSELFILSPAARGSFYFVNVKNH